MTGEEYVVRARVGRCPGRGFEKNRLGIEQGKRRNVVLGECRCGEERSPGDWRCYNEARYSLCTILLHFSKFVVHNISPCSPLFINTTPLTNIAKHPQ